MLSSLWARLRPSPHAADDGPRAVIDAGCRATLQAVANLAAREGLLEDPLSTDRAARDGSLRGVPVTMHSMRLRGGAWESLVVATIAGPSGALFTATVAGLPALGSLRPLLGIDLIAFGERLGLVALDLSPTDRAYWLESAAPVLRRIRSRLLPTLVDRKRPHFTEGTYSELAIVAAARAGEEAASFEAACALLDERLPPEPLEPARSFEAAERNLACRRAEQANGKQRAALGRMFGERWAADYIDEVVFPPPPGA